MEYRQVARVLHLLLNRAVFRRAYDPAFFAHLERPSFADHFRCRPSMR
jgi:hypothetical protein